jgi:hypothetical protein
VALDRHQVPLREACRFVVYEPCPDGSVWVNVTAQSGVNRQVTVGGAARSLTTGWELVTAPPPHVRRVQTFANAPLPREYEMEFPLGVLSNKSAVTTVVPQIEVDSAVPVAAAFAP